MNHAEAVAKRVLEAMLDGARLEYRPAQSHGEYDFDLRYPDGTVAAVEVTASVNRTQLEMLAAIRDRAKPAVPASQCHNAWFIFVGSTARIADLTKKIDGYLAELERAGIERFSPIDAPNANLTAICDELKVVSGSVISTEGAAMIYLSPYGGGGFIGADSATRSAEIQAWKEDNRRKLGKARTDRRHLVVYVDVSEGLAWAALTSFDPPLDLPNLPSEITDIWLVSEAEQAKEFVVWRSSTRDRWRSHRVRADVET